MKRNFAWWAVSCLMVLSLVLTACAPKAPAVTPPKENTPQAAPPTQAAPKEVTPKEAPTPTVEKPKYGGRLVVGLDTSSFGTVIFDSALNPTTSFNPPLAQVYEHLLMGDWTRGYAGGYGTNELKFWTTGFAGEGKFQETGHLAESWKIVDDKTITFKIRKGVHFQDKPPTNGRELTPDDIVFTFVRHYLKPPIEKTYLIAGAPPGQKITDIFIDPNDPQTVVFKMTGSANAFFEEIADKTAYIVPRDAVEKAGGDLKDWRNAVGTGPFILADYVAGSSLRLDRNHNYWKTDPIGPGKGNQLPYVDGVDFLYIGDASTQVSGMRTGKIDHLLNISIDDRDSLQKTNPQIKATKTPRGQINWMITIRSKSDHISAQPLKNLRVRQALLMAVDHEAIIRDYHRGNSPGIFFQTFPGNPNYTTLDQKVEILQRVHGFKPEEAQMLKKMYGYYPEEAKKLLAEAGYPNGFKTEILVTATEVDYISILADYWRKNLNVDLFIDVRAAPVLSSITATKSQNAMTVSSSSTFWAFAEKWQEWKPAGATTGGTNNSQVTDDPVILDALARTDAVYGDYAATGKIIAETEPYMMWLAWWMLFPGTWQYTVWQPWVRNYNGEFSIGYKDMYTFPYFVWLDRDMKKTMTGR